MKIALPRIYLAAMESARRPEAGKNELLLAHIIDALLIIIMCLPEERKDSIKET